MNLSPLPIQKFFANNGRPLVSGRLFTYEAGTSDKIATYIDASGGTPNTNPIVLDFRGECRLWIDPQQAYKFILAPPGNDDPPTNPIWTVDNITAAPQAFDNAAIDHGSVNNIELSIPQIGSPVAFTRILFEVANTNTGPTTISINGGTVHALTWQTGDDIGGGTVLAGGIYTAVFDGAQWQLQAPAVDVQAIESNGAIVNAADASVVTGDSLSAVQNTININAGKYRSSDGAFLVSAKPTNIYGVQFDGTGQILLPDPLGGYQQLNSYADLDKYCIGKEYLYRVYQRLIVGGASPIKAFAFGDSTIAGGNGDTPPFLVQTLVPLMCKLKGLKLPMTVSNQGVPGTMIGDMDALPHLAADTDLFFIKYGINDGLNPLTTRLNTFATNLRSKISAIRAATFGNYDTLSIVLLGPNSTNDSPDNRDERWYEQLRGIYVQAARDFQCMYFDTYAYLKDSRVAAGYWLDNPFGNGIGIHPQDNMLSWIWGAVVDAMFGQSEAIYWRGNHVTNTSGTFDTPSSSDAPSTYTYGFSVARATTGNGWPDDGAVFTARQLDGISVQSLFPFAANRTIVLSRVANTGSDSWNLWTGEAQSLTLQNSWVTYGAPYDTPRAILGDDGIVTVTATIKNGTVTSSTVLTTLPVGMRPAATVGPFLCATSAGNCSARVESNGNVLLNTTGDATYTALQFSFRAA